MLRVKMVENGNVRGQMVVLFADSTADVPSSMEGVEVDGIDAFAPGTIVYTAELDVGVLKSDNTWEWGE